MLDSLQPPISNFFIRKSPDNMMVLFKQHGVWRLIPMQQPMMLYLIQGRIQFSSPKRMVTMQMIKILWWWIIHQLEGRRRFIISVCVCVPVIRSGVVIWARGDNFPEPVLWVLLEMKLALLAVWWGNRLTLLMEDKFMVGWILISYSYIKCWSRTLISCIDMDSDIC